MADRLETKFGKRGQRLGAATTRSAVENVGLIFVESGDGFLKICGSKIDVRRSSDVSSGKLLRRADVEHHHVFVGDQLLRLFDIDVGDIGFAGVREGEATGNDEELCEEIQQ